MAFAWCVLLSVACGSSRGLIGIPSLSTLADQEMGVLGIPSGVTEFLRPDVCDFVNKTKLF